MPPACAPGPRSISAATDRPMFEDKLFWAYANIIFEGLIVFILPIAFAVRELILLRRDDKAAATTTPPPDAD